MNTYLIIYYKKIYNITKKSTIYNYVEEHIHLEKGVAKIATNPVNKRFYEHIRVLVNSKIGD